HEHGAIRDREEGPDEKRAEQDEARREQLLGLHGLPRRLEATTGARRCRRATSVRIAASATAAATTGTTRLSNIEGVMYSSESSSLDTMAASACAAPSFIASFTRRARTSSIPRKKPGKQHELLIWFG